MSIDSEGVGEFPAGPIEFSVIFGSELLNVKPDNTSAHTFDESQYNHVRHFPGEGQKAKFFQLDDGVVEIMRQQGFRVKHHVKVDTATKNWFISTRFLT